MTMSHLLRRTKKCCLKLLCKLSINIDPPTSNNNHLSSSRTTKYFKHKTKMSSSTPSTNMKRRKTVTSSSKLKSKNLKSYIKEETSTTTIEEDNDNSERDNNYRLNKGKTQKRCECFKTKPSQTICNVRHPEHECEIINFHNKGNLSLNDANNNSNHFSFNKKYLKNYFNFYKLVHNNKMIENNLRENCDKNLLNNDFFLNTNYVDDCIQFTDNSIYIHKNSYKPLRNTQLNYRNIKYNNNNNNNNNTNNNNSSSSNKNTSSIKTNEIMFEKVMYDKSKKYLSHSPSASVVPSPAQSIYDNLNNDNLLNDFCVFNSKNKSITSLYDNHSHERLLPYDPLLYTTASPQLQSHPFCERNGCTSVSQSSLSVCSLDNSLFDKNYEHSDDKRYNQQATNDPWATFDLNTKSNSLKINQNSQNYMLKRNKINDENYCFTLNTRDDLHNWCNNKISSLTLETWIDDEMFDNSFNEELEKRCATFEK